MKEKYKKWKGKIKKKKKYFIRHKRFAPYISSCQHSIESIEWFWNGKIFEIEYVEVENNKKIYLNFVSPPQISLEISFRIYYSALFTKHNYLFIKYNLKTINGLTIN